jgi:hypothetical protein
VPGYDKAGIREALVRALVQARRRDLPAAPPPGGGAPWYDVVPGSPEAAANAPAIVAADLASCLARKHWRGVLAIIRAVDPRNESGFYSLTRKAEAGRKREDEAVNSELTKMIPSVAGCVPAGAKLRIERPRLRSLLEEAAYHMTESQS